MEHAEAVLIDLLATALRAFHDRVVSEAHLFSLLL